MNGNVLKEQIEEEQNESNGHDEDAFGCLLQFQIYKVYSD
jgi:hypothetical protein